MSLWTAPCLLFMVKNTDLDTLVPRVSPRNCSLSNSLIGYPLKITGRCLLQSPTRRKYFPFASIFTTSSTIWLEFSSITFLGVLLSCSPYMFMTFMGVKNWICLVMRYSLDSFPSETFRHSFASVWMMQFAIPPWLLSLRFLVYDWYPGISNFLLNWRWLSTIFK